MENPTNTEITPDSITGASEEQSENSESIEIPSDVSIPQIDSKKIKAKKKRPLGDFLKSETQIKKRDEIKKSLKSFLPILAQAKSRNANESDTANIVHKFFQDILGWDFLDLTSEYKIKSTYCDLAIKCDGDILLLIEVKAIGLNLKDEHLMQASNYAANEGVKFAILTNGEQYRLYHVGLSDKINVSLVFDFNLAGELTIEDYTELYLLSKYSLTKGQVNDYWEQEQTLRPDNLREALLSDDVLNAMVKYFRSEFEIKLDTANIKSRIEAILK
jgi:hypothetical protein